MDWHDIPSLAALRAFEAAARTGGLTAAARELNVTHSAVAQHIRQLETHFGQSLMQREGKAIRPTPAGAALAQKLSEAFFSIGEAVQDLISQTKRRPLRISTTPNFAANWLMQRIADFWLQHPEIEVEILPGNALIDLRRDNVDIAIRYGLGDWPGLDAEALVDANFAVVASPDFVGARNVSCLEDLQDAHWLLDEGRAEEKVWLANNGVDLDAARVTRFATAQLTREAVRAGHGVTIAPKPLVDNDLQSGKLVLLCEETTASFCYFLVTRKNTVSEQRNAFVKWIRKAAQAG